MEILTSTDETQEFRDSEGILCLQISIGYFGKVPFFSGDGSVLVDAAVSSVISAPFSFLSASELAETDGVGSSQVVVPLLPSRHACARQC